MPSSRRLFAALAIAMCQHAQAEGLPSGSPIKPAPGWQPPSAEPEKQPSASNPARRPDFALPGQDGFYDPANPAYGQLQKANQALAGLPVDRSGHVDWMQLLRSGQISPRAGLSGTAPANVLDLDVLLKNTKAMPWVRFPHLAHTMWLDCANCHPSPFAQKGGTARITMESIFRGQWCGMCHDRVAFITHLSCDRCHSTPNPNAHVLE